jgi:hypothetical protein
MAKAAPRKAKASRDLWNDFKCADFNITSQMGHCQYRAKAMGAYSMIGAAVMAWRAVAPGNMAGFLPGHAL